MPRPKHPNKHVEEALQEAEERGWRVEKREGRGHAWGRMYCPGGSRGDCIMSVWSTPRNPENHARQIRHRVEQCEHEQGGDAP